MKWIKKNSSDKKLGQNMTYSVDILSILHVYSDLIIQMRKCFTPPSTLVRKKIRKCITPLPPLSEKIRKCVTPLSPCRTKWALELVLVLPEWENGRRTSDFAQLFLKGSLWCAWQSSSHRRMFTKSMKLCNSFCEVLFR